MLKRSKTKSIAVNFPPTQQTILANFPVVRGVICKCFMQHINRRRRRRRRQKLIRIQLAAAMNLSMLYADVVSAPLETADILL